MTKLTSATKSVQSIDGEDDREHIRQIIESRQQLAKLLTETSILEEIHGVHSHDADSDEFLHDLKPDSEENSPSQPP